MAPHNATSSACGNGQLEMLRFQLSLGLASRASAQGGSQGGGGFGLVRHILPRLLDTWLGNTTGSVGFALIKRNIRH